MKASEARREAEVAASTAEGQEVRCFPSFARVEKAMPHMGHWFVVLAAAAWRRSKGLVTGGGVRAMRAVTGLGVGGVVGAAGRGEPAGGEGGGVAGAAAGVMAAAVSRAAVAAVAAMAAAADWAAR